MATAPEILDSALGTMRIALEYLGTVAFAISGAVAAGRKRMDLVGAVVLACMVAIGGGTMRDVILDVPVFWMESPSFLVVGALTGVAVALLARWHPPDRLERFRIVQASDAVGLAVFVVVGTGIAIDAGASLMVAAVLGILTGVGGGVIRDMLANDVPDVLRNGQFYATAALAGAASYTTLLWFDVPRTVVFWVPIVVILAVRFASIKFGWGVPTVGGKRVDVDAPHGHPDIGHYGG
ncbi:trimeric intracellular cation channel family protein [Demequina sediminicola]|uniref:trimeric intracellular cation channel family protein n=1 Tax=Demequina sediminicola TaxID=1095026 RepID=UPI0013791CCA|nr:trimeric intracellular cation channel family protein [Demequina sediminicola]